MATTKLTLRLPTEDLEFARSFAQEHGLTVSELIDRYFRALQAGPEAPIHPAVERLSGLIPTEVDGKKIYREHLLEKHR